MVPSRNRSRVVICDAAVSSKTPASLYRLLVWFGRQSGLTPEEQYDSTDVSYRLFV